MTSCQIWLDENIDTLEKGHKYICFPTLRFGQIGKPKFFSLSKANSLGEKTELKPAVLHVKKKIDLGSRPACGGEQTIFTTYHPLYFYPYSFIPGLLSGVMFYIRSDYFILTQGQGLKKKEKKKKKKKKKSSH